jgi:hypothetical protein
VTLSQNLFLSTKKINHSIVLFPASKVSLNLRHTGWLVRMSHLRSASSLGNLQLRSSAQNRPLANPADPRGPDDLRVLHRHPQPRALRSDLLPLPVERLVLSLRYREERSLLQDGPHFAANHFLHAKVF